MSLAAAFETCPPIARGMCMQDLGYATSMCAMSSVCCVNAPVEKVSAYGEDMRAAKSVAALARWKHEREKVAA